jgi:Helix-turn-helix domain
MREDMGRALAGRRKAAGLTQAQFGARIGYTRSAVSHAETARHDDTGREFWEAADRTLGIGSYFTSWHDRIRTHLEPERRRPTAWPHGADLPVGAALKGGDPRAAFADYRQRGWPVAEAADRLELATGTVVDAMQVSRLTGLVAAQCWLETGGREDVTRGLPALSAPGRSLAVIEAGESWYFLVRTGASPWADSDRAGFRPEPQLPQAGAIRWHSVGGGIPVPPGTGQCAARWAYLPARAVRLAPPLAVLELLGRAAAMTRAPGALTLPGGAVAFPALITESVTLYKRKGAGLTCGFTKACLEARWPRLITAKAGR